MEKIEWERGSEGACVPVGYDSTSDPRVQSMRAVRVLEHVRNDEYAQIGDGELLITEQNLYFMHGEKECVRVPWKRVAMHAVAHVPEPCLYVQIDTSSLHPQQHETEEDDDEEEAEVQWKIVPGAESTDAVRLCDELYAVFSSCVAMNPDMQVDEEGEFHDTPDSDNDDDDDGEYEEGDGYDQLEDADEFGDAEEA